MQVGGNSAYRIRTGWSSRLARATAAVLLFQAVSGLAVTFGPFHPAVEWGMLLHSGIGIVTIAPLIWYLVRHWRDYSHQAISDVLILGYVGIGALALCAASGLAVTWQGLFGVRITPLLRYTHLVSTLAALIATVPHLVLSWSRRRGTEVTRPASGYLAQAGLACSLGAAAVTALALTYSGSRYRNEFPADYSFAYGRLRPFAPSLAHTSTNGAFDARSLAGSATCGSSGCHTQIYDEWKPSAHRYAAMDPIFQSIQSVMAKQNGAESTRYCGGCHDPISLFSGTKNIFVENLTGLDGYNEGISCAACHSIQKTDIRGNANYTISQPSEYL